MSSENCKVSPAPETGQDLEKNITPTATTVGEKTSGTDEPVDVAKSAPTPTIEKNDAYSQAQEQPHAKPGPSKAKPDSATEEELEYESEPACVKSYENRQKKKFSLKLKKSQGKTMYPPSKSSTREFRELAKKHFMLEKNLKIEGIPDPPIMRKRRMSVNLGRDKDILHKRMRLNSITGVGLSGLRPKRGHIPNWGSFGGDASDPLNLNGLAHSEEGKLLNLKTPENSPLPTPDFRKLVFVKIPPNIEDPLNLEGRHDQGYIDMLLTSTRKKRHRSKKNKDNTNQDKDINMVKDTNAKLITNENNVNGKGTSDVEKSPPPPKPKNEQSTPPKPGPTLNQPRCRSHSTSPDRKFKRQLSGMKGNKPVFNEPNKFPEKPVFTHGNYNRYYGYRNKDHETDPRLRYFNPHLFANKDVLDIGCNVGHVTLAIAEHFHPKKILGMDIDGNLISAARQNMRHMLSQRRKDSSKYPSVFEMTRGPIEAHPLKDSSSGFPNNVMFLQGNYVPGSEDILRLQKEEYDTILALSITKWIHLNNGDYGLKLFFQKIVRQLRPGGHLILEPQPWSTYRKRAKLSPEMFKNYSSIKLKSEGFKNYLLSIGFGKCEVIGVPVAKAKGFRRPLILFTKADRLNVSNSQVPLHIPSCTECPAGNQSECDHIQFTGMRRGAYAERMYDHISYKPSLRMPDGNSASCSSTSRSIHAISPSSGTLFHNPFSPMVDMHPSSMMPSSSSSPVQLSLRSGNSSASGGTSQHRSESSQSCSSSTGSGSASSSSGSSQSSGSASDSISGSSSYSEACELNGNQDPLPPVLPPLPHGYNGSPNSDAAEEIVWVNNDLNNNDNMEEENVPVQNGELYPLNNSDSISSEPYISDEDAVG